MNHTGVLCTYILHYASRRVEFLLYHLATLATHQRHKPPENLYLSLFSWIEFDFIMKFIMIVVTITGIFMAINCLLIYTLGFLCISNSGSANTQLHGCFCPWIFSLNIGLNMFPLDSFMSCLHSILGYSTGEFQALQLIVLAAFGAVD